MQPKNSPEYSYLDQLLGGNYGFPARSDNRSATAASENHKEAERKRRERINGHLHRLRSLLLCNSKIDKASLLAKVVQRVKELKQQTSEIVQHDQTFPSEADEIEVFKHEEYYSFGGKSSSVVKASLCCDDRADLVPDLIEILKSLRLSPLRAEMVTLGGRIRNVMILAGDENRTDESVLLLRDALKTLVVRSNYVSGERSKRRRWFDERMIIG
ncbi:hypothetical protein ABFS82_10G152600 [Erythranthe guttata]